MITQCKFVEFISLDHALAFSVLDAIPEREDDVLGVLPDGTLVHSLFTDEEDGYGFWLSADVERLLDDVERRAGRKALDAAPD